MLVLTRRPGEAIKIGDDITIILIRVDNKFQEAVIGIEAPKHIPILRTEIMENENPARSAK